MYNTFLDNIILLTDSYKITHWPQYPPNTNKIIAYFESRGGRFGSTIFYGLQYPVARYLQGQVVTEEKIQEAKEYAKLHFGTDKLFNEEGWRYILEKHDGYLPLEIKAVAEGTVVPVSNVLMTVENTDPKCFWLTNYVETLLVEVWYPSTVATYSREIKKIILKYLERTGTPEEISFKLHDFGFRGVSCPEEAAIGGSAHLVNFLGTDNLPACLLHKHFYGCEMAGFSIPASEHSTITAWGKDKETEAMSNMLDVYKDQPLIACVSDSYDIYNACSNIWGDKLKQKLMDFKGTLVVRPDSGELPVTVIKVVKLLDEKFGSDLNSKGYRVLNPKVRVIQGDGVNLEAIETILSALAENGYSADNIAFGSGGGLLRKHDRDTQQYAFKCSYAQGEGWQRDVWKDPITDTGKKSKRGILHLVEVEGSQGKSITTLNFPTGDKQLLKTVFKNGKVTKTYSLDEVRENAKL